MVKPGADRFPAANRIRVSCQEEESCLKSVLGVLYMVEDSAANPENHPAMPLDQCRKGGFIMSCDKLLHQFRVRASVVIRSPGYLAEVS